MDVGCELCSYAIKDSFDKCPDCGKVFETCILCGNKVLQKSNLSKTNVYSLLAKSIPIEEWGDRTGLKQALEIHLEYGDDIVRLALISFRQYLRDNFSYPKIAEVVEMTSKAIVNIKTEEWSKDIDEKKKPNVFRKLIVGDLSGGINTNKFKDGKNGNKRFWMGVKTVEAGV